MMGVTKDCVGNLDEITKWPLLIKSSLDTRVLMNIESNFASFPGLSCGIIQARSVALLEEITPDEAIRAVEEFCTRYRWASHKILRSVSGYFRGVCKKYWKLNREAKKEILMRQCEDPSKEEKSKIIDTTVDILFTKASELCKDLVDGQKRSLLLKYSSSDAIEALYEFCNAAMYREHKIRSMHAYLLNIIKRREGPAGNRMSKSSWISHRGNYRPNSAKSSRERTRENSSISQSPVNEQLLSGEENDAAGSLSPPITQDIIPDIKAFKQLEHLPTTNESSKTNTPGEGEINSKVQIPFIHQLQNPLDPKDWEPVTLPSRILAAPPERYQEGSRPRGGNSFRRARKNRRRYPFNPRKWRSDYREKRWSNDRQEIDPLSSIAQSRAEFTSGYGNSPGKSRNNPVLPFEQAEHELSTTKKPHFAKDSDILDPNLVEPFLGMLENAELEPGAYLPRILDPRFSNLSWYHPLTDLSPLE